jgi:hypothetical protein
LVRASVYGVYAAALGYFCYCTFLIGVVHGYILLELVADGVIAVCIIIFWGVVVLTASFLLSSPVVTLCACGVFGGVNGIAAASQVVLSDLDCRARAQSDFSC